MMAFREWLKKRPTFLIKEPLIKKFVSSRFEEFKEKYWNVYDKCATVADIWDDSRIALWESIALYKAGHYKNDPALMDRGIAILRRQIERIEVLMGRALGRIEEHPRFSEIKDLVLREVSETKNEFSKMLSMMEGRADPVDIDVEQEKFESTQFDRQHLIFLYTFFSWVKHGSSVA